MRVKRALTLDVVFLQVYPLQQWDEVGPTLSGPVLGPGKNVTAREGDRDTFLLARGHRHNWMSV